MLFNMGDDEGMQNGQADRTICDMHVHTRFSCDSTTDMETYCALAVEKGVDCVCFTDHVDFNPSDDGYLYYDAEAYFEQLKSVRDRYADRVLVLAGIEFASPHLYKAEFDACLKHPYDYVIGSVHCWYQNMFASELPKAGVPLDVCFEGYWSHVLAAVRYGGFNCMGHIDFPKRYYKALLYDDSRMREIFSAMIANNIFIEINTSSLRQQMDEALPDKDILSLYQACGGNVVAIGSDAHAASDLAAGNAYAKRLADEFQLTEVLCKNQKRQPVSGVAPKR